MKIQFYTHHRPSQGDPHFAFHGYAFCKYCDLPMTFRACISLLEQGLYSEAMKLIRPLAEDLVRLRYFHKHLNQIESIIKTGKNLSNKKVRIIDMWTDVATEASYQKNYQLWSKFGHNNIGSETSRLNMQFKARTDISLLPEFDKVMAGAVFNQLMYLLYGYLNNAPSFFSYRETSTEDAKIRDSLYSLIISHKIDFPDATEWDEAMNKVIGLGTPNNSAKPSNSTL